MSDFYYNDVTLLLNCNVDPFVDFSPTPKTITKLEGAALSTTIKKFGVGSLNLTAPGYLSAPATAAVALGLDYTVEAWINTNALGPGSQTILASRDTGQSTTFVISLTAQGALVYSEHTGNGFLITPDFTISSGAWTHVAVSFIGGLGRIYVDGNPQGAASTVSASLRSATNPIFIGALPSFDDGTLPLSGLYFNGFIDDVRITKGVGRYTAAFTPPEAQFSNFAPLGTGIDVTLPMLGFTGGFGGRVAAALPILTLETGSGAVADLTLPKLILDSLAFPVTADFTLPMLTFGGSGHDATGENSLTAVLPRLTFQADFGASATVMLPMLAMDAAAVVAGVLALGATLPALTLDAGGWGQPYAVTADITLPMITLRADFGADVALVLPMLLADAAGTAGGLGTVDAVLPMLTLHAVVTAQTYGWADLTLPMLEPVPIIFLDAVLPMLTLGAEAAEALVAAYEAYAVNLNHSGKNPVDEMTRYTNYPFTHIVRYQNSYFGVAADGLYLLEGTTDHATPAPAAIPWKLKTHVTDFGSPMLKTPVSVYVGGRLGQTETFTLYAGETSGTAHVYTNPRGATAQNYRQKLGRGVKARYFAVGLQGDGAAEIDNLEFDLNTLTRRI